MPPRTWSKTTPRLLGLTEEEAALADHSDTDEDEVLLIPHVGHLSRASGETTPHSMWQNTQVCQCLNWWRHIPAYR